ncbi:hypothetical protein K1T71_002196 [Dendrolimus kikuchii]|uniref:Uncharacterized protein n=1 Tax=Dendrolimus kikuchii TaxID=765133 RepID=A0ACC1DHC7_9NEOP|nr:hypothetical protein K1T71_002196 [Dendrolimus kikuchii]
MGQTGSQPAAAGPQRARRANTLPHEPPRHAPKVLPSLTESPRLRSTNNGAILHSGGTISGRRPNSMLHDTIQAPHGHVHTTVYRTRSAGGDSTSGEVRSRERDPLHRSHTNLDIRQNEGVSLNKRFGSEPDLRIEEEQQKARSSNKHFRKKYRAPPPPTNDQCEGSSPDSSEGNMRQEPQRKLRLFKTRNETKKLNGSEKSPFRSTYAEYKSLDMNDQAFERRYRSPCKDKEQHFKYPDNKDMIQSIASLKREERLLQARQEFKKSRVSGCRAKTSKNTEHNEVWKTPLLNRNFRYSDRFKKDDELPTLRREKTFDETLLKSERENETPRTSHDMKALKEQLKSKLEANNQLRKSLPSLLPKNIEEKDEFQAELKKATSRIRNELASKVNVSEKTSQNKLAQKPNPTKVQSKVKESSLNKVDNKTNVRRSLIKSAETKAKVQSNSKPKASESKFKFNSKERGRSIPDSRGQASGKESTPEHSPTRLNKADINPTMREKQNQAAPSKQFYFGMREKESKQSEPRDNLKDFPGLGTPIIDEITDFHLIEKKLLGYHAEDEIEKFNAKLKEDLSIVRICKNVSSESALSSEEDGSDSSASIAVCLRPSAPKKQTEIPKLSPAAAWRQLASLDAYLTANNKQKQPLSLAVEMKLPQDISPDSSPRSDQSADKSGDSGISGDHGHSDHRIDSPRHRQESMPTWTPQQDLGDSSSEGAGPLGNMIAHNGAFGGLPTFSPASQPFSLSLPRETNERGKQLQQGFNSLQKFRKSVSGAFGAALGSRRFDIEHEPMLEEPEQNWFLTKSAPNSLSNPLLYQPVRKEPNEENIKEEPSAPLEKGEARSWQPGKSYLSMGGHVMYLPPATAAEQPLSILGPIDRPVRSKSSGCMEASARAARAALGAEMRERDRSASPEVKRALPAKVESTTNNPRNVTIARDVVFVENKLPPSREPGEEITQMSDPRPENLEVFTPITQDSSPAPHTQPTEVITPCDDVNIHEPIDKELPELQDPTEEHAEFPTEEPSASQLEPELIVDPQDVPVAVSPVVDISEDITARRYPLRNHRTPARYSDADYANLSSTDYEPQTYKQALEDSHIIVTSTSVWCKRTTNNTGKTKRFTFQSTVRQLERRRLAEKLSKEADLKEQQRRTELEAMRRVEEEFQRKRAREKANIRQQLRLVSSGSASMPNSTQNSKARDEPDGSCRESPASDRNRDGKQRHSNASSEISGRSKSSTPIRCVELSEWRTESPARVYRDWASGLTAAHAHPPACAKMPMSSHVTYNAGEVEAFSGSPRSDNYRLEFARGRSPRTPRPPRLLSATRSPSTSGSEISLRQPIKISEDLRKEDLEEPAIVPIIRPGMPARKPPQNFFNPSSKPKTVAFEDVPLGSGGSAIPSFCRATSRQCIACAHRAKLFTIPEPATAPPILVPTVTHQGPANQSPKTAPKNNTPEVETKFTPDPRPFAIDKSVMSAKPESGLREALEDRDPNNLNQHVQIIWDDVIGEPEGVRSPECAWRLSHICFRHARNWCYTLLAVIIAPPCALCLGCGFACLAFEQIWCTAPCLRCVKIYYASLRVFVQACMAATVVPVAEAVGHICRHIRINMRHDAPEEKDLLVI